MLTGVSSSRVMWQSFLERYTRLLMEANPKFPIYFLNIYSASAAGDGATHLLPVTDRSFISRGHGEVASPGRGPVLHAAPNQDVQPTPSSVRCAPASRRA